MILRSSLSRVGILFFLSLAGNVNGGNSFRFNGVYHGILGSRGKRNERWHLMPCADDEYRVLAGLLPM